MWSTVIATAVAAALGLTLVNVAREMNKIRDAQSLADITRHERNAHSAPTPGPAIEEQKPSGA